MVDLFGGLRFLSKSHQECYKKKGFFVVPFLKHSHIKDLESLFHSKFNIDNLPPVFDSIANTDPETIRYVNNEIHKICYPLLNDILGNFKWVCSIFFLKKSSEDSFKGMHLDTSMTTEDYNNVGIWIPLCDIDDRNGKICFLPGSQNFLPPYSNTQIPYAYENVEEYLLPKLECVGMKAGEALFFNNSLLHCTQKNISGNYRIAVIIKVIDSNAPLATVYYDENAPEGEKVKIYEHFNDFFIDGSFKESTPPRDSEFLGFVSNLPKQFEIAELEGDFLQS